MASYQVICITKPTNGSHEHITHIGYHESVVRPKVITTVEEAIKRIDSKQTEFYVQRGLDKAYVIVVRTTGHKPFIKTKPDHTAKDNLLSLPQC